MTTDCDVLLYGTGLAPLVAASVLVSKRKSVLLLNPDFDYFQENSELSLDPLIPVNSQAVPSERLKKNLLENVLPILRPDFPGPVESWTPNSKKSENQADPTAPYVRSRSRLWLKSLRALAEESQLRRWEEIESLYVRASDAGLHPQTGEGLSAGHRFPGYSGKHPDEDLRSVQIPGLCDLDVTRYRTALLEYLRERLGPDRVICAADQLQILEESVRFRSIQSGKKSVQTTQIKEGMLVFWTPRLIRMAFQELSERGGFELWKSIPLRIWEEWSLLSRERINPETVGAYEDMIAWADTEGSPDLGSSPEHLRLLTILRAGPTLSQDTYLDRGDFPLANADSFQALSRISQEFMGWDQFSIRSMRPRVLFDWSHSPSNAIPIRHSGLRSYFVTGSDGPVFDVIRNARSIAETYS